MASIINASNSGFGGIVSTGDSSGELQLQTAGTTAVTINTSQNVTTVGNTYLANSSGSVGINTTSPSTKLDVNSGSAGYALTIQASGETSRKYQLGVLAGGALSFYDTAAAAERMRIDSSGNLLVGPSATGTYPYNAVNTVNYKRQLTSGSAQAVFTFTKTNTTVSSSFRNSFMGNLYVAFSGRTSGGTTSSYGFNVLVNIASNAGNTITMASSSVTSLNGASSGLTVSCAVSLTSASATSATLSVTITQTAGTLQDNELTAYLTGANSATDSTNFFTVTPA